MIRNRKSVTGNHNNKPNAPAGLKTYGKEGKALHKIQASGFAGAAETPQQETCSAISTSELQSNQELFDPFLCHTTGLLCTSRDTYLPVDENLESEYSREEQIQIEEMVREALGVRDEILSNGDNVNMPVDQPIEKFAYSDVVGENHSSDYIEDSSSVVSAENSGPDLADIEARYSPLTDPLSLTPERRTYKKWSEEETEKFYECLRDMGKNFVKIAEHFPGRTLKSVRTKFEREIRSKPRSIANHLSKGRVLKKTVFLFPYGLTMRNLLTELYEKPRYRQKIINCTLTPDNVLIAENMVVFDEGFPMQPEIAKIGTLPLTLAFGGGSKNLKLVVGDVLRDKTVVMASLAEALDQIPI